MAFNLPSMSSLLEFIYKHLASRLPVPSPYLLLQTLQSRWTGLFSPLGFLLADPFLTAQQSHGQEAQLFPINVKDLPPLRARYW